MHLALLGRNICNTKMYESVCANSIVYKDPLFYHLQQLQEAVEQRNEIIARLSSNLQEAVASRDQVQLEAQSLAGQIQALQRQLQQVTEN